MLPTFVTIGAMKAGTSSLHRYLAVHPEIGMSRVKETNFFRSPEDFAKGVDWYQKQFSETHRICGETATNYAKVHCFPGTAERMYAVLPTAKLVYVIRHPVDRLLSHYVHNVANGKESRSINSILEDVTGTGYFQTSCYGAQIDEFLRFYPVHQVLLVLSEDLRDRRRQTLSRIFRFVGVEPGFWSPQFDYIHNASQRKRADRRAIRWIWRNAPLGEQLKRLARRWPLRWIGSERVRVPALDVDTRTRLCELFSDNIDRIEELVGRPLIHYRRR